MSGGDEPDVLRRLGYYIARPGDTFDFKVLSKPASEEVLAEMKAITDVVFLLRPIVVALESVQKNRSDLKEFVAQQPQALAAAQSGRAADMVTMLDAMVGASRLVGNFLSSTTALLSLTEASLMRTWGQDSVEFTTWNHQRRAQHAVSFAYRLLYELRNFAQHRGLPISSINVAGRRSTDTAPMVYATQLRLRRDALMVDGFDWAKLKPELERQPEEFDLLPLVDEYAGILEALVLDVFMTEGVRLVHCVRYMQAIKRILQLPDGAQPAMFLGEAQQAGTPPPRMEIIPMNQLYWLMRRWDSLTTRVHPPAEDGGSVAPKQAI